MKGGGGRVETLKKYILVAIKGKKVIALLGAFRVINTKRGRHLFPLCIVYVFHIYLH